MADSDIRNPDAIAERLRRQACDDRLRISIHGHQEMIEEDISYDTLRHALLDCTVVENYPDHQRGSCCLACGLDEDGRHLHVVCTTSLEVAVVITTYEPKPPKWITPFQRGEKS